MLLSELEIKEILSQQLQLLAKQSNEADSLTLCQLTHAMHEIVNLLQSDR